MINSRSSILVIISFSTLGIAIASNYLTFDQTAFAADNCDSSSNCTNAQTGIDNTQTNDCTNFSLCQNGALGDGNTQANRCDSAVETLIGGGCTNFAEVGDGNTQTNDCTSTSSCVNVGTVSDGNTQTNDCTDFAF